MDGLLDELGKKIADRWLASVLLPGLVWVFVAVLARQLGWAHALDTRSAERFVRRLTGSHSVAQEVAVAAGFLIAAVGVAMAASGLATVVRRIWVAPSGHAPMRWFRGIRQWRWTRAKRQAERLERIALGTAKPVDFAAARARQAAISLEPPESATWIGDRWRVNGLRIQRAYGLEVDLLWPRLWALLPDPLREDIATAQQAYEAASIVAAWAVLYALVGIAWGPALLIAAGVLAVGAVRARSATETLCQLVETATDLYGTAVAEQLRIPCHGRLNPAVGWKIAEILSKKPQA